MKWINGFCIESNEEGITLLMWSVVGGLRHWLDINRIFYTGISCNNEIQKRLFTMEFNFLNHQ
jgi:hypothetical protein